MGEASVWRTGTARGMSALTCNGENTSASSDSTDCTELGSFSSLPAFTSAPAASNKCTTSAWPFCAAKNSGDRPCTAAESACVRSLGCKRAARNAPMHPTHQGRRGELQASGSQRRGPRSRHNAERTGRLQDHGAPGRTGPPPAQPTPPLRCTCAHLATHTLRADEHRQSWRCRKALPVQFACWQRSHAPKELQETL